MKSYLLHFHGAPHLTSCHWREQWNPRFKAHSQQNVLPASRRKAKGTGRKSGECQHKVRYRDCKAGKEEKGELGQSGEGEATSKSKKTISSFLQVSYLLFRQCKIAHALTTAVSLQLQTACHSPRTGVTRPSPLLRPQKSHTRQSHFLSYPLITTELLQRHLKL